MDNNYFFIDGSALFGDITRLFHHEKYSYLKSNKLNLIKFARIFQNHSQLQQYHGGTYKRVVFYFASGDPRIKKLLKIPSFTKPGVIIDFEIKHCGKKLNINKEVETWLDEQSAPQYVRD
jgi:hypothetical protein